MASYGALWRARFDMMRPGNAAMATVGVLIGALLAGPATLDGVWPAMLAAFLITAFGNVLNDITDRHIDAVAHPRRPLPSGRLALNSAKAFAVFLLGWGLLQTLSVGPVLLGFAVANAAILTLYDWRLKRWPLIGNVVVGALVASTFAFGAVATGTPLDQWGANGLWLVMAMVLLSNLARELLKDIEDAAADEGRLTLPRIIGPSGTGWLASIALGIAIGIDAALVWTQDTWSLAGRAVLAGSAGAFLVAGGLGCYQAGLGQRALKWAMLVALAGLLLVGLARA